MKYAIVRLLLALLFVVPAFVAELSVSRLARPLGPIAAASLSALAACLLGWAAYAAYVRLVERRPLLEFGRRGALKELAAGLLIGAALFGTTIAVLAALGLYRIQGTRELSVLIVPLAMSIGAGVIEEIMFRGVIFRIAESSLGTWFALLISAALFGLVHLGNPRATVLGAVSIIFEAGIMLAGAYLLTRRLWLPIGIHIGWNFTQGGVFSVPVSGFTSTGFFDGTLSGPEWLSGGEFGAEASIVAVVACVALALAFLRRAAQRGHFIAPHWRRRAEASSSVASTGATVR
jgi:membrane protease YdiL (CAAX protease family)